MKTFTAQYLREYFEYDQLTGLFYWKRKVTNAEIGQVAGTQRSGYVYLKLHNKGCFAHRVAWLFIYGEWPSKYLDHINGIRSDNRICNLREATQSQNMMNSKHSKTHAMRGLYKRKTGLWQVKIGFDNKRINIGNFKTLEEAQVAYANAAKKFHGEFSVLNRSNEHISRSFKMARKPSIVLTPAEKKAALIEAKAVLKAAQAAVKQLVADAKTVAKARAAEDKAQAALVKTAEKSLVAAQAGVDALVG